MTSSPELESNLHPEKDRDVKIIVNRCDLCNDHITKAPDDIEAQIDKLVEVNVSYESERDKQELDCCYATIAISSI